MAAGFEKNVVMLDMRALLVQPVDHHTKSAKMSIQFPASSLGPSGDSASLNGNMVSQNNITNKIKDDKRA